MVMKPVKYVSSWPNRYQRLKPNSLHRAL